MVSGSKLKVGLIVVLAILIISLITNFYFYCGQQGFIKSEIRLQTQLHMLTTTYDDYAATHSNDNIDFTSLELEYENYMTSHTILDEDYANLQTQYNNYMSSSYSESEYNSLQSTYDSYQTSHTYTDSQYNSILTENINVTEENIKYLEYFNRPLRFTKIPTINELQVWLNLDETDQLLYHSEFDCKDFSALLSIKVKNNFWNMGIIAVWGYDKNTTEEYRHAFNYIETIEGLVYVEPQNDNIWWFSDHDPIEIGTTYGFPDDKWIVVETLETIIEAR